MEKSYHFTRFVKHNQEETDDEEIDTRKNVQIKRKLKFSMQQTVIMLLFCYNKTDTITRHNDGRPLYVVGDNGHDND